MTQLEYARQNIISGLMKEVAAGEGVPARLLMEKIRQGKAVIPLNKARRIKKPCAIGQGLATKVNANIGTSTEKSAIRLELEKLSVAVKYGADTVMDLSVGANIRRTRQEIIRRSPVPLGTVPIYEIAVGAQARKKNFLEFTAEDMLAVIRSQAEDGVDFFTIHAGVTKESLAALKKSRRLLSIVSRGGAMIAAWVNRHKKENPFYEHFDAILDIAYEHDVTLSLGDGMRPGSVLDATDKAQISELKILGELAKRARRRNVQVMIEGPGHVPLNQVEKNVRLEKKFCAGAPFYVLGPLVTDIGAGYDHITAAIGGAVAAGAGADFLCYVTPAEHLRHPSIEDVREGVVASRIAAHAADIVKFGNKALLRDKKMSLARKARDWKEQARLSVDPDKARAYRLSSKPHISDVCTMCGNYCSIKVMEKCLRV